MELVLTENVGFYSQNRFRGHEVFLLLKITSEKYLAAFTVLREGNYLCTLTNQLNLFKNLKNSN